MLGTTPMRAFICPNRPRSVNAKRTATFKRLIQDAFNKYCAGVMFCGPVCGRIYYFRSVPHELDADNLSKPIIDALVGLAFADDALVELRHSGIVDLNRDDISGFDLTRMPDEILEDFMESIGTEKHLIYVELGDLRKEMFIFG